MKAQLVAVIFVVVVMLTPPTAFSAQRVSVVVNSRVSSLPTNYVPQTFVTGHDRETISVGSIYEPGIFHSAISTAKLDRRGRTIWRADVTDGNHLPDVGRVVTIDAHGNVYVNGYSFREEPPGYTSITVKYSPDGQPFWTNRFEDLGEHYFMATSIAADRAGNVAVTLAGQANHLLLKINSDGSAAWHKEFPRPSPPWGASAWGTYSVAFDSGRNVIAAGGGASAGGGRLLKYDGDGSLIWSNDLAEDYLLFGPAVVVGANDRICVGVMAHQPIPFQKPYDPQPPQVPLAATLAATQISLPDQYTWTIASYGNDGIALWTNRIAVTGGMETPVLATDSQGAVYAAGRRHYSASSSPYPKQSIQLTKFGADGRRKWGRETFLPPRLHWGVRFDRVTPKIVTLYTDANGSTGEDGQPAKWYPTHIAYRQGH
ncbi:MAG TPA: hypothetical protein VK530_15500 [Candidatus Acidoferrum sp.]|nr:hypothetical protein [Candidatus Acidoferrum sp.]